MFDLSKDLSLRATKMISLKDITRRSVSLFIISRWRKLFSLTPNGERSSLNKIAPLTFGTTNGWLKVHSLTNCLLNLINRLERAITFRCVNSAETFCNFNQLRR